MYSGVTGRTSLSHTCVYIRYVPRMPVRESRHERAHMLNEAEVVSVDLLLVGSAEFEEGGPPPCACRCTLHESNVKVVGSPHRPNGMRQGQRPNESAAVFVRSTQRRSKCANVHFHRPLAASPRHDPLGVRSCMPTIPETQQRCPLSLATAGANTYLLTMASIWSTVRPPPHSLARSFARESARLLAEFRCAVSCATSSAFDCSETSVVARGTVRTTAEAGVEVRL